MNLTGLVLLAAVHKQGWLTGKLLAVANTGAEWVLWVLIILSMVSLAIMVERFWFYRTHKVDSLALRRLMVTALEAGTADQAAGIIRNTGDSMEARVAVYGLRNIGRGHKSARELMMSAIEWENKRYERFLWFLATLGNNAPFFGLFGTVLGVIMAFDALGSGTKPDGGGSAVMGPIAEALIATAVGLLVAIPAVLAFNIFKIRAHHSYANTEMLSLTMLAFAHSTDAPMIARSMEAPAKAAGLAKGASPETKKGKAMDKRSKMAVPAEPEKAPEAAAAEPAVEAAAEPAVEAAAEPAVEAAAEPAVEAAPEAAQAAAEVVAEAPETAEATAADPATKTSET